MEKTKKPYYRYCAVPECKNTIASTPKKLFFVMPRDENIRKQWCKAMQRNEVSPSSCLYCCEDHFDLENDVENWIKYKHMGGRLILKKGVVPHIFDCQNENPKKRKKRKRKQDPQRNEQVTEGQSQSCQSQSAVKKKKSLDQDEAPKETEIRTRIEINNGKIVFPSSMEEDDFFTDFEDMTTPICHEGTEEFVQVKVMVLQVYHYLQSEYEQLKSLGNSPHLSPLSDILSRTAGATGVSVQTVTALLDEEEGKRLVDQQSGHDSDVGAMQEDLNSEDQQPEYSEGEQGDFEESKESLQLKLLETMERESSIVIEFPLESSHLEVKVEHPDNDCLQMYTSSSDHQTHSDPLSIAVKTELPRDEQSTSSISGVVPPKTSEVKMEPSDENSLHIVIDELPPKAPHLKVKVEQRENDSQTAYNRTMADQPDLHIDPTDLPSSSSSNFLPEVSYADPPVIPPPKTKAQKQREYRQRLAASRTAAEVASARKSAAERQRICRLRKAANSAGSSSVESTTATPSRLRSKDIQISAEPAQTTVQPGIFDLELQQAQSWNTKWASSILRFKSTFLDNDFGYPCSVCDRLWFKNELKPLTTTQMDVISEWYSKEGLQLCKEEYKMVCNSCKRTLNKKTMPILAKVNGFSFPEEPAGLPPLDPISERLISPRLPFMQVRRLRQDLSGVVAQVINVPVDVLEMTKYLPRQLDADDVINVNIERKFVHNSVYISKYMSKSTISAWLNILKESPLYRLYDIDVDLARLHQQQPILDDEVDSSNHLENISDKNTPECEILSSRQHTMMWNEEDCLNIPPGHQATPLNTIQDRHAEELSFPSIYFGEARPIKMGVSVTPHMIASSEIRRRDRRGATPQKVLYVAMKILRQRMVDGIHSTIRNVSTTEIVTRRMLEDTDFLKEYGKQNLAFMKTVSNSVQYWASRKRDLFAIIRQLGKPTAFLTISANEIRWMNLLNILLKLSKKYPGKTAKDLNTSERCSLVNDDPVTCCIYFYKLVGSLMKMLKSKQSYNPFGKYSVKDYFLRIEFQGQGSPCAHILLWLNDDPREMVSENMPKTIDLVEKLCSVSRDDVPNDCVYSNQIHKHSSTCTKPGETCRIPYWPMTTTRVLGPIPQCDGRLQSLQQKAKELRTSLVKHRYSNMDEFLNANDLTYDSYLDIVRSTLRRPTLVFKRKFNELMTDTFNPYLAGEVNSKIDIQFILDDYSCAEYIAEYMNKSSRGMSNLHRALIRIREHPYQDYTGQFEALSSKLLNAVEMTAQEAAWYLLRQPMTETSRPVVYIPTVWPAERQCCRKRRQQMDREGLDGDSTDVWTKNIIQRYEERPPSLEQVYLAEFASWYANANDFVDDEDVHLDDDEDSEAIPEGKTSRAPKEYRRRQLGRIIRYKRYDVNDTDNYKREMVLLYVQFRNEMLEIVDQNNFLQLFDHNKNTIMQRKRLFETNLNIENVMKEIRDMVLQNDDDRNLQAGEE